MIDLKIDLKKRNFQFSFSQILAIREGFTRLTEENLYGFGARRLKIRDVCMDLEPCSRVRNLVVIEQNNTKLGQMTNLKVAFLVMVSIDNLTEPLSFLLRGVRLKKMSSLPFPPVAVMSILSSSTNILQKRRVPETQMHQHKRRSRDMNWSYQPPNLKVITGKSWFKAALRRQRASNEGWLSLPRNAG